MSHPPSRRHQTSIPTMAPVTRAHRIRATITGENIEPLSPTLAPNIIIPDRLPHSHVRFDQDEGSTPITVQRDTKIHKDTGEANSWRGGGLNGTDGTRDKVPDGEEDSDNDAPEAVSMNAGKEEAEKREEKARRVTEAYVSPQPIPGTNYTRLKDQSKAKRKRAKKRERSETQN